MDIKSKTVGFTSSIWRRFKRRNDESLEQVLKAKASLKENGREKSQRGYGHGRECGHGQGREEIVTIVIIMKEVINPLKVMKEEGVETTILEEQMKGSIINLAFNVSKLI